MKTATLVLALAGASTVSAAIHLPFSRTANAAPANGLPSHRRASSRKSLRRDTQSRATLQVGLTQATYSYVVNVTVGTPPQRVALVVDTLNADTWVPEAAECAATGTSVNCAWGSFNGSRSSTFVDLTLGSSSSSGEGGGGDESGADGDGEGSEFEAMYDDGTYAWGDYITDVITLADTTVKTFQMGYANEMTRFIGGLGLGFETTYSNFPEQLWKQGVINTTAYSMWLDAADGSSGSLLFGGVDTTKFNGTLARLSSASESDGESVWALMLTAINVTGTTSGGGGSETISSLDLPAPLVVSPSDTISNLPPSIASQIWTLAGATYDADLNAAMISCSTASSSSTLSFNFKLADFDGSALDDGGYGSDSGYGSGSSSGATPPGPILTVPIADLIISPDVFAGSDIFSSGAGVGTSSSVCVFGIQNGTFGFGAALESSSGSGGSYSLGSTLLKRQYAVFDLVNNEIALAPVRFAATSTSSIVPFATYGAHAPGATRPTCATGDASCTTATASFPSGTGAFGSGDGGDGSGSGFGDEPSNSPGKATLSPSAIAGIVVLSVVAAAALFSTVVALIWYRGKRKNQAAAAAATGKGKERDPETPSPPQSGVGGKGGPGQQPAMTNVYPGPSAAAEGAAPAAGRYAPVMTPATSAAGGNGKRVQFQGEEETAQAGPSNSGGVGERMEPLSEEMEPPSRDAPPVPEPDRPAPTVP